MAGIIEVASSRNIQTILVILLIVLFIGSILGVLADGIFDFYKVLGSILEGGHVK